MRRYLLGVALLALTVITLGTFVWQNQQSEQADECREALIRTLVTRAQAASEERDALRQVVRSVLNGGTESPQFRTAYYDYEAAIDSADLQRATLQGSLNALEDNCQSTLESLEAPIGVVHPFEAG